MCLVLIANFTSILIGLFFGTAHSEITLDHAYCKLCPGCTPYNHPNPMCRAVGYHNPNSECKGNYTFYTHPDEYCKSILQKEYKEMVKRYLEAKKAKGK